MSASDKRRSATDVKDAADVVRELQRELNDAYGGISTLPREHPAVLAYERADKFLAGLL